MLITYFAKELLKTKEKNVKFDGQFDLLTEIYYLKGGLKTWKTRNIKINKLGINIFAFMKDTKSKTVR